MEGHPFSLWHNLQINAIRLAELKVPPRVYACIFITHAHAWCTNSRFGGLYRRCQFCNQWGTEDNLKHIACCSVVKQLALQYLKLCHVYTQKQFLLLEAKELNSVVGRRALHLYATKRAYDSCRNGGSFVPFVEKYQAALLTFYANNQCKQLLCKTTLFGKHPDPREAAPSLFRVSGSVQTVLQFQPRSSL